MWVVYAWRGSIETGIEIETHYAEAEESAARWQRNAKKPNKVRVEQGSVGEKELRKLLWNRE